jgi:sugar transferase EpsL
LKRLVDLLGAGMLLCLLSPIFLCISLLIISKMGRPIFFKQLRPGLNEKPFYIYKFRTMNDKKDEEGNMLPGSMRLTKLGAILRKYSLDELPQLLNVLKGDLSLVGPRPLLMEYLKIYNKEQKRRHDVKPGITGWAQVNGRNTISWDEKFKLDTWYVENRTLWLDIKILLLTMKKVVAKDGVSANGHYSMERYKGL